MDVFKVCGESREVGAIGIFEPFMRNIAANSSKQAYDLMRQSLYSANRDHVLIKAIYRNTDNGSELVEPRAYLG